MLPPLPSHRRRSPPLLFFFNDTAPPELYTLSLHDALPICPPPPSRPRSTMSRTASASTSKRQADRKSTRLNSSHEWSSYAGLGMKKKNVIDVEKTVKKNEMMRGAVRRQAIVE